MKNWYPKSAIFNLFVFFRVISTKALTQELHSFLIRTNNIIYHKNTRADTWGGAHIVTWMDTKRVRHVNGTWYLCCLLYILFVFFFSLHFHMGFTSVHHWSMVHINFRVHIIWTYVFNAHIRVQQFLLKTCGKKRAVASDGFSLRKTFYFPEILANIFVHRNQSLKRFMMLDAELLMYRNALYR